MTSGLLHGFGYICSLIRRQTIERQRAGERVVRQWGLFLIGFMVGLYLMPRRFESECEIHIFFYIILMLGSY